MYVVVGLKNTDYQGRKESGDELGDWDIDTFDTMYKIDN